jgi:hypothetical protein
MTQSDPQKVVTGRVRLSYVHVWEPFSNKPDQEAKYSVTVLVPKSDKKTVRELRAAQQAALEAGKSKVFGGTIPKVWKDTIHDGDEEADLEKNPELEGMLYFTASSKAKPGVVDADVSPIMEQSEVYSGCYARVSLRAFAFSNSGNKGVSFGLGNVQKLADGDSLGGSRARAEDDFTPIDAADADLL